MPFVVPENYFSRFADEFLSLIAAQENRPAKFFALRRWYAVAAAVALLFSVGFMSYRFLENRQIAENQENYDTYLMSQIDNNNLMEYYFTSYDE